MDDDIRIAPEIKGVHCPVCGGGLLFTSKGVWCDWCDEFVNPVLDEDLLESSDGDINQLLEQLEKERKPRGHRTHHSRRRSRNNES